MIFIFMSIISDDGRELINRIFSKMNVKMYNISYGMLRSSYDAEEALAQTFLKIINNIEKISALPCPQIEPYCVTILKNESTNIIRQRKKIIYVEEIDSFDYGNREYNIDEEYLQTVNKEILLSYINKLSDEERNFIYLRFVNEMRFKNISELLGITEDATKKRSQRILKKLRSYYEEGDKSVQNG